MGRAGLQRAISVCNSAAGVIMEMSLDVTGNNTTEGADEIVDLSRRCAANSIGDTNTVYADLVHGGVEGEEVNEVGAERIFAGEADLDIVRLDEVDNLNGSVCDVGHVLAMRMLHEI